MKTNILIEGFKMACELLALEICDSLFSYHKEDVSLDWEISTWNEFPGAINQDKEAKDVFIETLNMYLRAASCSGKWELDSDRDDLGVEVIGHDKMTLHLIKA
jgi:hypothetical protein